MEKINWTILRHGDEKKLSKRFRSMEFRARTVSIFGFLFFSVTGYFLYKNSLNYLYILSFFIAVFFILYFHFWGLSKINELKDLMDSHNRRTKISIREYFFENYLLIQDHKLELEHTLRIINSLEITETETLIEIKKIMLENINYIIKLEDDYCLGG